MALIRADRTLVRNATSLFGGQAVGLIVPLATIPYLARVLHPSGWAPLLVAQALANWLIVMLEFGFDLSGTRAVARVRHDPALLSDVVRGVQSARLALVPLGAIAVVVAFSTPALRVHGEFFFWLLAFAVFRGLNPFWFFQGLERMHGAVIVEAATKALGALGVFVVVREQTDGWKVLALQAAFAAISLVILTVWMARITRIGPPNGKLALAALKDSWTLFAFRASSGLYIQANAFILSLLAGPVAVAMFGGAERIVRAAINLLQPLTQAFFPRVSHLSATDPRSARQLIDRSIVGIGLFGGVLGAGALIGAPVLVRVLLGPGYEDAIPVMRMLAPLPPLVAVNTVLGLYWAIPFGRERAFLATVAAAAAVSLGLVYLLVPLNGASGMCAAVIAAEFVVMLILLPMYLRDRPRTA